MCRAAPEPVADPARAMTVPFDLDPIIARHASVGFDDSTPLLEAGLESLSLLRLAVDVATDDDAEIDATRLVELRTVGDLKEWLGTLVAAGAGTAGASC